MIATAENLKDACGIYGVIHRDSGRVYVGRSVNLRSRLFAHRSFARDGRRLGKFYAAIKQYGEDAFDFEVLERCEPDKLNERERFYIQFMDSVNNGFNLAEFPEKSRFGVPQSAETRKKMSASQGLRQRAPEVRAALSEFYKGRKFSEEWKANIRKGAEKRCVPVIQLSLDGEFIAEHRSLKDAALSVGAAHTGIYVAIHGIRGAKTCRGFRWKIKPKNT